MLRPAIAVNQLTKRFDSLLAVDHIGFQVAPGETVGLLGGNGAGKTTTISMMLGLLKPTSGEVRVLGADMVRHRYKVLHRINFSSPYVDLPHRLTVRENLIVYAHLYGLSRPKARIRRLIEGLSLEELERRRIGSLSAGQKTRVALAKALLNEPEVLLLDEPTASLDPDTADWVRSYLERYRVESGAAILLASHNMGEVERLCSMVLMMRGGRIVDRGTPTGLVQRYGRQTLEEVFLDIARQNDRFQSSKAAQ
jgi:ABC-2 type transport system ATP-binding protein